MAISNTGLRMGIDLSGPVRVVLLSGKHARVVASMTAQTGFEQDSKERLRTLASEIREFWKPYKVRPYGIAGLPAKGGFLFTVSLPHMSNKELKQAIRLQVERIVPGSSHNVRMAVQKWPAKLPLPPSSSTSANITTYVVAAADADLIRAAEKLMNMAGVKPVGVEVPASPACRMSWWMWAKRQASASVPGDDTKGQLSDINLLASFNIALDIHSHEALLHLAFDSFPWLMREIPLDPKNTFGNARILAGEVSRSVRFVANSWPGELAGGVTVMGSSSETGFISGYLGEQVGIKTQVCDLQSIQCDSEYGLAVGLALPKEGALL